jgi:hypothetical protein
VDEGSALATKGRTSWAPRSPAFAEDKFRGGDDPSAAPLRSLGSRRVDTPGGVRYSGREARVYNLQLLSGERRDRFPSASNPLRDRLEGQ